MASSSKSNEVVDLRSPPRPAKAIRIDDDGAILLDDDHEDGAPDRKRPSSNSNEDSNKRSKATSNGAAVRGLTGSRILSTLSNNTDRVSSNSTTTTTAAVKNSAVIAQNPARAYRPNVALPAATAKKTSDDDDEEICLVGTKGTNVLTDFPHSREHCVLQPMGSGDHEKHCPKCYCYCCDAPVVQCRLWSSHCHATHKGVTWQRERERVRLAGGPDKVQPETRQAPQQAVARAPVPAAVARVPTTTGTTTSTTNSSFFSDQNLQLYSNRNDPSEFSVQELLKQVASVYPREVSTPMTIQTPLKHYQRQSLAMMLDVENSTDAALAGSDETGIGRHRYHTRGGWLASEVGMGKTLMIIALVASDRGRILAPLELNRNNMALSSSCTRVKATLIVTSVSLLGQWEDEVLKHAPGLVCYRFHNSSRSSHGFDLPTSPGRELVARADIIITASTSSISKALKQQYEFQRIVIDESHLPAPSISFRHVKGVVAQRRWCVTATPCVSSLSELDAQIDFIGLGGDFKELKRIKLSRKLYFFAAVDTLKSVMTRHFKEMNMNDGSEALSLPGSTSRTVILQMSVEERQQYNMQKADISRSFLRDQTKFSTTTFRLRVADVLLSLPAKTKCQALLSDIQRVRQRDANLRVVVFTQYTESHKTIIKTLRRGGIDTLEFSGSTKADRRDKAIREFQSTGPGVKAFVITTRAGSVGMTLTAAKRVYLMEPSINPATEIQAAGRINRLGQTSKVTVTKFAFSDSLETNIIDLHQKVSRGEASLSDTHIPKASMHILISGLY
ncbi:Chromodomain-helicase-DNA-binding protein 1 [Seminavis robusta]|uniref:Chromodomain-helicase-DNA-binding protein 1 n=1 Tax=Seminavis robusta TaxID=568900 RepID=A0A9N8E9X1_9STRA|nr:Chromodomain-helicase-DNA-binding protein 1 [Seminavis robusta]|eukprot:Sro709_g190850.1 Chromodomain-helicase-DNA-binding protein 1 (788) ;mRNA; f:21923-24286